MQRGQSDFLWIGSEIYNNQSFDPFNQCRDELLHRFTAWGRNSAQSNYVATSL